MLNDRFLAIPAVSHQYDGVNEIADLPAALPDEQEHFLKACNEITGKVFEPLERATAAAAYKLIQANRRGQ